MLNLLLELKLMENCHEREGIQFDPTSCGDHGNYTMLLNFSLIVFTARWAVPIMYKKARTPILLKEKNNKLIKLHTPFSFYKCLSIIIQVIIVRSLSLQKFRLGLHTRNLSQARDVGTIMTA